MGVWVILSSTYARGGLAKGVLGVYKGGGWLKEGSKCAYVICTQPLEFFFKGQKKPDINTF